MESNLIRLLDSQHLDEVTSEICDFTLEEQNQFAESQGVKPSAPSDYVPVLGTRQEGGNSKALRVSHSANSLQANP